MTEIKIIVPGQPVPQGRPKFANRGSFVTVYDPPKSKAYKKLVAQYAVHKAPKKLLEGELEVEIQVFKETLKSFSRANKVDAEARLLRPITKPDADNYAKGPLDALKGIIWKDDGQVVDLHCSKYYSSQPRIEIIIREVGNKQEELF